MRTLFDTSVLVPALVDQLERHDAAFAAFRRYTGGEHAGFCATHALAECYATLTALPIPRRISPESARTLIQETVCGRLTVVALTPSDYTSVIAEVAALGLSSGAVYDALHARCATNEGVEQILTYNFSDFERFGLGSIAVIAP